MTTNRSFQFFPGATAAMLLGVAILAALGTWQLHRRAWKMALVEAVTARVDGVPADLATVMRAYLAGEDPEYTPVATSGRFVPSRSFTSLGPSVRARAISSLHGLSLPVGRGLPHRFSSIAGSSRRINVHR